MNRRITITILVCLAGLWSAVASAGKINPPPPVVEVNPKPPAPPQKPPPAPAPEPAVPPINVPPAPVPPPELPPEFLLTPLSPLPLGPPGSPTLLSPPKLPAGALPADSLGGHLDNRLRQLEEGELLPGLEGGESGVGSVNRAVSLDDFAARAIGVGSVTRVRVVSDRVIKTGSKISGGWREYAADWSWRRVVFTLDDHTATIVFSDGKPGSRLPSVTHYAARRYASDAKHYASEHFLLELDGPPGGLMPSMTNDARSGPGPKGSPATYDEIRIFPGTTPVILDKAKQSSPIPSDVATRIREIGGDIKVMQQMADFKRISELGSALDAARATDDGGFFPDRPGGSPGEANWSAPWRGVGRGGAASDGVVSIERTDEADGSYEAKVVTRHKDGSTTESRSWRDADGSHGDGRTERDAHGNVTEGSSRAVSANGDTNSMGYTHNPKTGEIIFHTSPPRTTPSEVPFSGRGGFDEARMAKSLPWLMDAYYSQWKRESDLVKSGGRISQPGRGEQPTLVLNEGPEVGANGVVNCGDSNTNPCARPAGVAVDARRGFGSISQPGRGVEPEASTGPRPIPVPEPQ